MEQYPIQFSSSTESTSLQQILVARHDRAVSNLVNRLTPPEDFINGEIQTREVRGGGGSRDYIPGWWFIREANDLFNFNWNYEIVDQFIGADKLWVKGRVTVHVPGKYTKETRLDGTIIETISESYSLSKMQFGGSDVKRRSSSSEIIDIGDDLKSAATDAMKKCLTQFGLAADIYGPHKKTPPGQAKAAHTDALYAVFEKVGKTREDAVEYVKSQTEGKMPEELTEKEILSMLPQVRKVLKE